MLESSRKAAGTDHEDINGFAIMLDRSVLQVYVDIIPTGEFLDVLVATKKLVVQIQ
jgi:hypothetical protein